MQVETLHLLHLPKGQAGNIQMLWPETSPDQPLYLAT
jgi:hypothetical protein